MWHARRPQLTLSQTFFRPARAIRSSRSIGARGTWGSESIRRITQPHPIQRLSACRRLGLIFATPVVAETAPPSQGSIIVEGNRRVDAETVRSYFHAAPDGHFDDDARDAALKALIATGLFDKVSIERAGERLVVHLSEAPVLDRVAFEGNKKVKDTDLAAADRIETARLAATRHRASRRRPHHRGIPACRPLRSPRRSANHRPRQWPGRPHLRHNGGSKELRCGRSTSPATRPSANGSSAP